MTQSISNYIRDAILSRVEPLNTWKSVRKVPLPTLQAGQTPSLGVYLLREQFNVDGDGNVGPPRYIVDATFSVSVIDSASSPSALDGSLDAMIDLIMDTLLRDGTFIDLRLNGNPVIDSIPQINRGYSFPQNGDAYYVECRLQMTIRYFCYFDPLAPNALTEIDVDTKPFDGPITQGQYTTAITLDQ